MRRMAGGFDVLGRSGAALRRAPGLLVLAVAGGAAGLGVSLATMLAAFGRLPTAGDLVPLGWLVVVVAVWAGACVTVFANAAVTAAAVAQLGAGEGLRAAGARLPRIVAWASGGAALAVGRARRAGQAAGTYFALPVLVAEDVPVAGVPGRSAELGPGATDQMWALAAVTAAIGAVLLPVQAVLALTVVSVPGSLVIGAAVWAVWFGGVQACEAVVRAERYRAAVEARPVSAGGTRPAGAGRGAR